MADENETSEFEKRRPRRVDTETLSYLNQVRETVVSDEIEDKSLLLWNVLEELQNKSASIASDRHASDIVEVFVDAFTPKQMRYFLNQMTGYYFHLWTNRYSSHVLQKIFSKVGSLVQDELDGKLVSSVDDEEDRGDIPTMSDLIETICKEIHSEWLYCVSDISASHVVRSMLCVLNGVEIVPEKRGKKGKHKGSKPPEAFFSQEKKTLMHYKTPDSFKEVMDTILEEIMQCKLEDLQDLSCNVYASPVLSMLLRIVKMDNQEKVYTIMTTLLVWENQEKSIEAVQVLSNDPIGSHFLEAVIETCSDNFYTQLYNRCFGGKLAEFCQEPIANFVVQHLIMRAHNKEMIATIFDELKSKIQELFSIGRPGVIWRLVDSCGRLQTKRKSIVKTIVAAIGSREKTKPESTRKSLVPALLSIRLPQGDTPKLWLDVPCARIVHSLLLFPLQYSQVVLDSILSMEPSTLVAIAKDSMGSRCVVEAIWDSPSSHNSAKDQLFDKFKGSYASLACDRLGCFTVLKAFGFAKLEKKILLAEELLKSESRLSGVHHGQLALRNCRIQEFKVDKKQWSLDFEKGKRVRNMFNDILDTTTVEVAKKARHS